MPRQRVAVPKDKPSSSASVLTVNAESLALSPTTQAQQDAEILKIAKKDPMLAEMLHPWLGWRARLIYALARNGTLYRACQVAGVSMQGARKARKADPKFEAAVVAAQDLGVARLEAKAWEIALADGSEYAPAMLRWILAHKMPETYGDRRTVEHVGGTPPVPFAEIAGTQAQLEQVMQALIAAGVMREVQVIDADNPGGTPKSIDSQVV